MMSGTDMLLNTTAYAMAPLLLFLAGNVAWAMVYGMVFLNIRRHGAVEIPAAAVASNFAWVTVWGLCYRTDTGTLFVWANRGAILLELALFAYVLVRGARHVRTPEVRRWFKAGLVASYACWAIMLYLFAYQKYETPNGIISGMVIALYMSTLYAVVELSGIHAAQYSLAVGWGKLLGNLCGSLFCAIVYPANHFLLSLCAITFVLDVIYLVLFRLRKSVSARVPAPA